MCIRDRGVLIAAARRGKAARPNNAYIMGRLGPGRRLLEVLWPLRNYGIGAKVTKPTWTGPDCFWQITKLKYTRGCVYHQYVILVENRAKLKILFDKIDNYISGQKTKKLIIDNISICPTLILIEKYF